MTAGDAGYTIDPIRGQANDALLPAIPAPVVGWRLAAGGWRLAAGGWRLAATLSLDGHSVKQHEHRAFDDAQHEGAAWLQQHGSGGISQWMAQGAQPSRRTGWDHD